MSSFILFSILRNLFYLINKKMHICEIKKYGETSFSSAKNILQKDFT